MILGAASACGPIVGHWKDPLALPASTATPANTDIDVGVRIEGTSLFKYHEPQAVERIKEGLVVTCYLRYIIDPHKVAEFENYAKMWIPLVDKLGGKHLGYFLPHEGANNVAIALFNFPSLAAYEEYRQKATTDPECQAAIAYYQETRCFLSFERSFMKPVFK